MVAASHTRSAVTREKTSPIMSNVLIETDEDCVRFLAHDTTTQVEAFLPAVVERAGGTTVSAAILHELARRLPEGAQVGMEFDPAESILSVNTQTMDGRLVTLPREDFTRMAEDDYDLTFSMNSNVLRHMLSKTVAVVSPENARQYLRGVFFHLFETPEGAQLRCVASDAYQLVRIVADPPEGSAGMSSVIVPHKAVQEVIKMLSGGEETVEISVSETKIKFATQYIQLSTRVINGEFPDYTRLIPRNNDRILTLDRDVLLQALLRLSAVVPPHDCAVLLNFTRDHLNMKVNTPAAGKIDEDLSVSFPHDDLQIRFRHGHLLSVTQALEEGIVKVALQETTGAVILTSDKDTGALFVLMPINV